VAILSKFLSTVAAARPDRISLQLRTCH